MFEVKSHVPQVCHSIPESHEGEAEEEAECAAHVGHQVGPGVEQHLRLHRHLRGGHPQLNYQVLAVSTKG